MQTKLLSLSELRDKGYLQEVNRRFFHLLGLALCLQSDKEGNYTSLTIIDKRNDEGGIYFNIKNLPKEEVDDMHEKSKFIDAEIALRIEDRIKTFGSVVEGFKGQEREIVNTTTTIKKG